MQAEQPVEATGEAAPDAMAEAVPDGLAETLAERSAELRAILENSGTRVLDFFRMWDADGSGEIEADEFRPALRALGLDVTAEEAAALFATFDVDHSGNLSHKEMYRQLRAGADMDLSGIEVRDKLGNVMKVDVAAGAKGKITLESKNEFGLRHDQRRKRFSALPAAVQLAPAEDGTSVQQQLRHILAKNSVRVIDLFRDWDEDQSGAISPLEFRRSIGALGFSASREEVDALFAELDADGSGLVDYAERECACVHVRMCVCVHVCMCACVHVC